MRKESSLNDESSLNQIIIAAKSLGSQQDEMNVSDGVDDGEESE